jgi:hypothetical protein
MDDKMHDAMMMHKRKEQTNLIGIFLGPLHWTFAFPVSEKGNKSNFTGLGQHL